ARSRGRFAARSRGRFAARSRGRMMTRAPATMPDDRPRTPRTLLIPDHVWEAFAAMAAEMGGDRDALISQALYTFARLNGFLVPSDLHRLTGDGAADASGLPTPRTVFPANGRENVEVDGSLLDQDRGAPTTMELPSLAEMD